MPSLRFSFRDHLSLVGRRKYPTRCHCQSARHISHLHELFQFGFERRKCPSLSASAKKGVRRERPIKEEEKEEFEEEGSKEDGDKAPAQRGGKFQRALNVLHLHEDNLPLWLRYCKPINQTITTSNTHQ